MACSPGLPASETSSSSSTSEVAEDTSEASEGSELTETRALRRGLLFDRQLPGLLRGASLELQQRRRLRHAHVRLSMVGSSCGDLEASDVVWADENSDRLLLCNRACEAFAMLGVAEVEYGCPPG